MKNFFLAASGSERFPEYPDAPVTTENITYASSIDPTLVTLKATLVYVTGATNLPVRLFIHGYHEAASNIDNGANANLARYARLGYFVVAVEMRGSNGSSGTFDDGGRETMDCIDALNYVITNHTDKIAPDQHSVHGFSFGGFIAYLLCTRFPDLFVSGTVFFGVSDVEAWYSEEPGRQATLAAAIGGNPATVPDFYAARNARAAIATNHMGFTTIFHHAADTSVDVSHSREVVNQFIAEDRTDYYYNESTPGSPSEWEHQYPSSSNDLHNAEPFWKNTGKIYPVNTAPASGYFKIIGLLKTKGFLINMNNADYRNCVKSCVGEVTYDMDANTFSVTNLSANNVVVTIKREDNGHVAVGALAPLETFIFEPESIEMLGQERIEWYDPEAKNLLTGSDVSILVDKSGSPRLAYQGYSLSVIPVNRPGLLNADLNGLDAIEFVAANSEGIRGLRRPDLQGLSKYTHLIVDTGIITDHGASSTRQTQFGALSGGSRFIALSNGTAITRSYADTATYSVRSEIFNNGVLIARKNKVQQTLAGSGTIPATTETDASSVRGLGVRSYSATFVGGKLAEEMTFDEDLSADIGDREDLCAAKFNLPV